MTTKHEIIGGGKAGIWHASIPFAKLTIEPELLSLKITFIGSYSFSPEQVSSIEPYGIIPFMRWGLEIHHTISEYPTPIVFWGGSPKKVLAIIEQIGFRSRYTKIEPSGSPKPLSAAG